MALSVKRRYHGIQKSRIILKSVYLLSGFVVVLFLGSCVWGELNVDPFPGTPLFLEEGAIRFKAFYPEFKEVRGGRYISEFENGLTLHYTIDPKLQKTVESYLKKYRVPYGAFVAIDPKTGKVLALVDHSTRDPEAQHLYLRATYPAASVFKVITAAAVIEEKQITPHTKIRYRGQFNHLKPIYWKDDPKEDKLETTLADALAHSNNVVFAKVAYRWLDTQTLVDYGVRFLFNRPIPFESPVEISRMVIEASERGVARAAAGFGSVNLSPVHAALLAAAIANDGVMMRPCLVDFVTHKNNEKIYECVPKTISKTVSPKTAATLREMMGKTVQKGTAQEFFRPRDLERSLRGISIAGKTGSFHGTNPPGRVNWFIAMAPLEDPEIVVAAMLVNDPVWHILAPQLAKVGLASFFGSRK